MTARLIPLSDYAEAARILRDGGLVGFPTDTVYGVAAMADENYDNARLRELKGGRTERFSLHAGSTDDAIRYSGPLRAVESHWVNTLAGHGVTLVVSRAASTLGLRVVRHPQAAAFLAAAQAPVVATSANLHGQPVLNAAAAVATLPGVDAVLDGGVLPERPASTVIRLLPVGAEVLRPGALDIEKLRELGSLKLEFVCLGNLNRSAFAEGMVHAMQAWLAARLPKFVPLMQARSSGLIANAGMFPPQAMLDAAEKWGVDLSGHVPSQPDSERLDAAAIVIAMGDDVADQVGAMTSRRVWNFKAPDPMGGPPEEYTAMAAHVSGMLREALARWATTSSTDGELEAEFRKLFFEQGDRP